MTNLTVIRTSPDAEQGAARARRRPSIAARIGSMGQNRIGALLLLVATLAAIVWANVSLVSYETFWETHLMVAFPKSGASTRPRASHRLVIGTVRAGQHDLGAQRRRLGGLGSPHPSL